MEKLDTTVHKVPESDTPKINTITKRLMEIPSSFSDSIIPFAALSSISSCSSSENEPAARLSLV
jgi:hypothetical protein